MKAIGCLRLIVLIGVGIFLLTGAQDADQVQQGQWVGEKAHRGWNKVKRAVQGAQQGWKSVPAENQPEREQQ